jgi:hypothetical protein
MAEYQTEESFSDLLVRKKYYIETLDYKVHTLA